MTMPRLLDGAALLPYLTGAKAPDDLDPALRAHVATLLDHQALHAVTRPTADLFIELDPRSQAIYHALTTALAGYPVYATGSRVKGTWRSGAPDDPKTAVALRLGLSPESDVDVVALGVPDVHFATVAATISQQFNVKIDRQPARCRPLVAIPLILDS